MATTNTLRRAESLFGYGIQATPAGERTYTVVGGTIYTDLFTGTPTIDGYTGTIKTRFNGSQSTTYYNEIIVDGTCKREVDVTATWGNADFLTEIAELLTWLDENTFTDMADNAGVKSVRNEDFAETYGTAEETNSSFYDTVRGVWSFYIRNVILIGVSPEQKNDHRYF